MSRNTLRLFWLAVLIAPFLGLAQEARAVPALRVNPVFKVGVLTDNYPFSFRDQDGQMKGFAYDIVAEIEQLMALKFQRVEGTTDEINAAFVAGRLDLLQSYVDFPERRGHAEFSVPYLTMTGAIFTRKGTPPIRGLGDLADRRVLVHRGSLGETVLRRAKLDRAIVYSDSVEESLKALNRGEGDAVLGSRLNGLVLAHQLGLTGIEPQRASIAGYDVRYCIAVRSGQAELLAKVNEGLAVLVRTGRFDEIHAKWFGQVEPPRYTGEQVTAAIAVGLALALAVAVWAAAKQRSLRRQIMRQAEQLRSSEERHRRIFEGARDGLVVLGAGRAVEQINPAACRLLDRTGLPPADVADLFAPDVALGAAVTAALDRDRAEEFEHQRPGEAGWLRVSVSPLGAEGRWLIGLTDLTEAVRGRQRLQLQEEQLRQKQKLEAVGTLAGGVAHDFNNLLTAIMGNTELCLMSLPADHPEAPGLKLVLRAARRARDLVQQILAFSRQSAPRREVVALGSLVEETINLLRTLARGTVDFVPEIPAGLPEILADPAQVHQVLMNLGTNAVQAMRGTPGRLSFRAEQIEVGAELQAQHPDLKPGSYVRLTLQDTGPGMSPEVQRRIFEPFFTTKPPGEGTGLGLSVVHGIMRQHGGVVTLYSQVGRGTLFQLYFPTAATLKPELAAQGVVSPVPGHGERVLFVDDDEAIVQTGRKILEHLGYVVSAHVQPAEAWREYERRPADFALVVSDLTMPELGGLELLARVRALRRDQPFVLSSGFFSEAERDEAAARGATVLLPKPISYATLGQAAAAALGRN